MPFSGSRISKSCTRTGSGWPWVCHSGPEFSLTAVIVVLVAGIAATAWRARVAIQERNTAEARELSASATGTLYEDPERSLILDMYSWGKRRAMVGGYRSSLFPRG